MEEKVLFRGDDVVLISVGLPSTDFVCVTFTSFLKPRLPDEQVSGFGQKFLLDRRIPALHFISLRNHWWQTSEMAKCFGIAAPLLKPAASRMGYGSSMGGYGALNFSAELGLDSVLAFAPQFSVDPLKIPEDRRYLRHTKSLSFVNDTMDIREECLCYTLFDPQEPDLKHIELIEQKHALVRCELPGTGHTVIHKVKQAGLLESFFYECFQLGYRALCQRQRGSPAFAAR